ncbi:MAG TPA: hypothetical protein VKI61_00290 [Chitinophagaceae bacterium]|nr:hypothetical protein [Chitinophagaceae bacterium]
MNIEIPKVSKEFEALDFHQVDTSSDITTTVLDNGSVKEVAKQSYGYVVRLSPKNSYFIIIKQYYKNGGIKEKGVLFNSGFFKAGNWYRYNEKGELVNEENNDKGFEFDFNKVYEYLRTQHIDLTIGHIELYSGFHTTIEKDIEGKHATWVIRWLKEPQVVEEIILDGTNGKLLTRRNIKRGES